MTEIKWKQEASAITPKHQFHIFKINTLSCCRCIYRRVRALQSSLCDLEETDPAFRHIQGLSADISHKSDQDLQLRQILQSGIHRQILRLVPRLLSLATSTINQTSLFLKSCVSNQNVENCHSLWSINDQSAFLIYIRFCQNSSVYITYDYTAF